MRVTILGCGGSSGVPLIGNRWGNCNPANPRNRRLRPSILVEHGGTTVLVDTTPDLREQLLAANVQQVDGVLYTHAHADHCHGIDDLRELCRINHRPVPVYAEPQALADLQNRFGYCFKALEAGASYYRPQLLPCPITGPLTIGALEVQPFRQDHGWVDSLGFRFGDFAYSTDLVRLDEAAFEALAGITVWVVDCVRLEPHPVHSHLEQTLEWIRRVGPRRAWLTHMNQTLDYDALSRLLPAGVAPAHDGLVIDVDRL
jgi:phosphoribosyl 1,2-cyclic phosphate phosphodiesterase